MAEDKIKHHIDVAVIGGSAGSLEGILTILPALSTRLAIAIVIVLHRKPGSDGLLVELLESKITWPVKEAEEKEPILPGNVYVAPSDYHLLIEADHTFSLDDSEKVN